MLRACKRLLQPGGRTAFLTIFIPEGLTAEAYIRAVTAGPPFVATRREHAEMLLSAGFELIEERDLTDDFLRIARSLFDSRNRHEQGLRASQSDREYETQQMESRAIIAAIEAGLLRRALFVGKWPARR